MPSTTPSNFLRRMFAGAAWAGLALLAACGGGAVPETALESQTISLSAPTNQVFGGPQLVLGVAATSSLGVTVTSTTPAVCTVAAQTLTLVSAGSCSLLAEQAGNATYAPASPVSISFTVAKAAQTINFVAPGNQTLGGAPVALTATASSGLPVDFTSTTPATCTVSGSAVTLVAAGGCSVTAQQPGNANYLAAASVASSFDIAVNLVTQSISFAALPDLILGNAPAQLSATATSGLTVSFSSMTVGVCTVAGNTLTLVTAGSCTVAASQAGNAGFAAAPAVSRSFTVAPAPLTA